MKKFISIPTSDYLPREGDLLVHYHVVYYKNSQCTYKYTYICNMYKF